MFHQQLQGLRPRLRWTTATQLIGPIRENDPARYDASRSATGRPATGGPTGSPRNPPARASTDSISFRWRPTWWPFPFALGRRALQWSRGPKRARRSGRKGGRPAPWKAPVHAEKEGVPFLYRQSGFHRL